MKHKSKFAIFMIAAAATIAVLFATVGKPHYMKHHHGHCAHEQVREVHTK